MPKPLKQDFIRFAILSQDDARFRGMRKEGSPATLPGLQFRHLENVRLVGNEIQPRGGQVKINASALSGTEITGIHEYDPTDPSVETRRVPRIFYILEPT